MAHTERLYIQHLTINGDGWSPDSSEGHLDIYVLVRWSLDTPEVVDIDGYDLHAGVMYGRAELERRADAFGRADLDDAIADAIERFEHTLNPVTLCRESCGRHGEIRKAA